MDAKTGGEKLVFTLPQLPPADGRLAVHLIAEVGGSRINEGVLCGITR